MKYKNSLILFVFIMFAFVGSFSFSQNIFFDVEWDKTFGYWCIVPIDVYVNTEWQEISAMDLVMETSLLYKDFVPTDMFPYYLPPVIKSNGLIHIVWFTVDPSERIIGSWKIWTLYFDQKPDSFDWAVRLYFLSKWDTTDSNLSMAWWVDLLKNVGDINIVFSKDLPKCTHDIVVLTWWFAWSTYKDWLDETIQKIYDKYGKLSFWLFFQNNIFFIIALFLIVVAVLAVLYHKKLLYYFNKNTVWRKSMQ